MPIFQGLARQDLEMGNLLLTITGVTRGGLGENQDGDVISNWPGRHIAGPDWEW